MMTRKVLAMLLALATAVQGAAAEVLPPGEKEPMLRLEAGGPTALVTALAFSSDGKTLYAAGLDKVVRVWSANAKGEFSLDRSAYRVPLGPGLSGAINAIALSPDQNWLAVAGRGVIRGEAGFRQRGWILPSEAALTNEMREDEGLIFLFQTKTQAVHILRGHRGPVYSLAFAPSRPQQPSLLVSVAAEWDKDSGKHVGTVRLWDVEKEEYRGGVQLERTWDRANANAIPRPGLSVWSAGNAAGDLHVAIAWDDGYLHVWDVGEERRGPWRQKEAVNNITAAYAPDRGRLITAGSGTDRARLKVWSVAPGRAPQLDAGQEAPAGPIHSYPRALSLLSSQANGELDHAAVVVRVPDREEEYRLQLLDLGAGGAMKADELLWQGAAIQPVVATSPRGEFVAVAGNQTHEIVVYCIRDLLNHQPRRLSLRGTGINLRHASFVKNGNQRGLLLNQKTRMAPGSPSPEPAADDEVFDFSKRSITADTTGWKADSPAPGEWRVRFAMDQGRGVFSIHQGERLVQQIKLADKQVASSFALLPPRQGAGIPILAIAYHEAGQPTLALYNGTSGEKFRQYTGHSGPIYSLAFSGDGKLLVSTAQDQTVCIWSLTNVDKVLGRLGMVPGVVIKAGDNSTLVVNRVEADSPVQGKLQEGETIEGLVEATKLRSLAAPRDFYEAVAQLKPGTALTVRVRGNQAARDVALVISQGIDERKPLLSLFLTRADQAGQHEWIGWSPMGPYESSGQPAERHLGWHFNTGDASGPTRFALADQYRKQYYREGILDQLVTQGELQRVPPPAPPPPPKMALLIEEGDQPVAADAQGQMLVRRPKVNLKLLLIGRAPNTLEAATYQVDDAAEMPLDSEKAVGQEWSMPLELRPGLHSVRVTLRTPEAPAQPYVERLSVRYQPPAPEIKYTGQVRQVLQDPAFVLRAGVTPSPGSEGVRVVLRHTHKGKAPVEETKTYNQPASVEHRLTLQPGYNLLELVAVNAQAVSGHEALETQRLAVEVTLVEKTAPPQLSLDTVLPDGAKADERLTIEPGKSMIVMVAKVRLQGKITASENLSGASWVSGAAAQPVALPGFVPNQKKEWPLDQEVQLQPGAQTFRFLARAGTSDEAERSVTLFYQPPVPGVTLIQPVRNQIINGEKDQEEVVLQGDLQTSTPAAEYQAEVRINDQVVKPGPQIDKQAGKLTARLPVRPGDNRISVRLSNQWGAASTADVVVHYQRPPRILDLPGPQQTKQPTLDLAARVRSPLPLLPESVRLLVNGAVRAVQPELAEAPGESGIWILKMKGIVLEGGSPEVDDGRKTNELQLSVNNKEGACLEPAKATLVYQPVQPLAEITFAQQEKIVDRPDLSVRFVVTSESPLKQVRIALQGEKPVALDIRGQHVNSAGRYSVTCDHQLTLKPKSNTVQVEADNAGGQQVGSMVVSLVDRPVRLEIDSLEPIGAGEGPVPCKLQSGGTVSFDPMPSGRVRLHGRVLWDEKDDKRLDAINVVKVFVNEFQQLPSTLRKVAGKRERAFQVDLWLNYEENQISLALPGLPQDNANCLSFNVMCKSPVSAQRLHLLVVSPHDKDEKGLREQFLQALHCKPDVGNQYKTDVFDPVFPYGPIVGDHAQPQYVYYELAKIKGKILGSAHAGAPGNDVVVFYYLGNEAVNSQGHFFPRDAQNAGPEQMYSSISCDDLVNIFADTPGAHILLLEVGRGLSGASSPPNRIKWNYPDDVKLHVAMLRLAWLGPLGNSKSSRLLKALEQAMPRGTRLVEVTQQVRDFLTRTRGLLRLLDLDPQISKEMEGLVFSRKQADSSP